MPQLYGPVPERSLATRQANAFQVLRFGQVRFANRPFAYGASAIGFASARDYGSATRRRALAGTVVALVLLATTGLLPAKPGV